MLFLLYIYIYVLSLGCIYNCVLSLLWLQASPILEGDEDNEERGEEEEEV